MQTPADMIRKAVQRLCLDSEELMSVLDNLRQASVYLYSTVACSDREALPFRSLFCKFAMPAKGSL